MHVMIDLETIGTRPNAMIVQIGAVLFEPVSGGKVLNGTGFKRTVLPQDGLGTVDASTIAWWLQQPGAKELGRQIEQEGVSMSQALLDLLEWPMNTSDLQWEAVTGVWSNGAAFDQPILANAFQAFGRPSPWGYEGGHRVSRCCRTLFSLVGGPPQIDWTGFTPHDALDDAVGQAMQVQKAMGELRRS